MALYRDDIGERTQMPSALRLEEARRQGRVARSRDLPAVVVPAAGLVAVALVGEPLVESLVRVVQAGVTGGEVHASLFHVAAWAGVIALACVAAAVAANLVQVGFLVAGERIVPDAARLSPIRGAGRIFSLRTPVGVAIALAKLAALLIVAGSLWDELPRRLVSVANGPVGEVLPRAVSLTAAVCWRIVLALTALAILDCAYQRWQHRRDLRMTRREMHEDQRRMQIDPQLRRKRESLSRRIAARRLANDAESADAVVTGRGGLGVALVYDATTDAPHVIARGRDWQGQRLRELAQDAGACVIEDAQLARRLYRACDAGDAVPEELHEEIAEVLAFARNLRKEPRT